MISSINSQLLGSQSAGSKLELFSSQGAQNKALLGALSSESRFTQASVYSERVSVALSAQDGRSSLSVSVSQSLAFGLSFETGRSSAPVQQGAIEQNAEPEASGLVFDIDKVVDTVVGFVGSRIGQAQEEGATDEQLSDLFDAARSGVETGFAQARDQIAALNKLNDELAADIDSAETGIYQGIDDLQSDILPASAGSDEGVIVDLASPPNVSSNAASSSIVSAAASRVAESTSIESSRGGNRDAAAPARGSDLYARSYERSAETFDFQLTTRDGDVVTIRAFNNQESFAEAQLGSGRGSLVSGSAEQSGYSLQVQGDLDDDELLAIQDLLNQVDAVAQEFYSGDIGTAFNLALELQSDPSEIAKFSLDLTQSSLSYAEFSNFKPASYDVAPLPRGLAEPLAEFASSVRDTFESASRISQQPAELLEQLFDQFDQQQNLSKLLDPLLTRLSEGVV